MTRLLTVLCWIALWGTTAMAQAYPVTIPHEFGETVVPQKPLRVVSVGYRETDYLYQLGVAPVGVRDWWGGHPYATWPWAEQARAAVNATPQVFSGDDLNYEWIVNLDPDLIIAVYAGIDQQEYDRLSQIAPTIAPPRGYPIWGVPWQQELRIVDHAVNGDMSRAQVIIADIEAQFATVRAEYPELAGKTATNVYWNTDRVFVLWGSTDVASRFLLSLGMVFPPELDAIAQTDTSIHLSPENIKLMDLDAIVWPIDDPAEGVREEVEAMPVYANTRLAKQGRSVWLSDAGGVYSAALSFQTPLSMAYLIDVLPPMLAAAVDGDPATVVPDAPTP